MNHIEVAVARAIAADLADDAEVESRQAKQVVTRVMYRRDRIVAAVGRAICTHGPENRFRGCDACRALATDALDAHIAKETP